jgi:hypothetical protein
LLVFRGISLVRAKLLRTSLGTGDYQIRDFRRVPHRKYPDGLARFHHQHSPLTNIHDNVKGNILVTHEYRQALTPFVNINPHHPSLLLLPSSSSPSYLTISSTSITFAHQSVSVVYHSSNQKCSSLLPPPSPSSPASLSLFLPQLPVLPCFQVSSHSSSSRVPTLPLSSPTWDILPGMVALAGISDGIPGIRLSRCLSRTTHLMESHSMLRIPHTKCTLCPPQPFPYLLAI